MKTKSLFSALMLALAMSSCQEPEKIIPTFGDTGNDDNTTEDTSDLIKLVASASATSSKVGFEQSASGEGYKISLSWEATDTFDLYDSSSTLVGSFKYSGVVGASSGEFTQTSDFELTDGESYTARFGGEDLSSDQLLDDVTSLDYLNASVRMSAPLTYSAEGENSLTFVHQVALLRLVITMEEGIFPARVTLQDGEAGNSYSLTLPTLTTNSVTAYMAVESNDNESRTLTFTITDTSGTEHPYSKEISSSFEAGYLYGAPIDFTEGDGGDGDDDADQTITDYYKQGYTAANGITYDENSNGAVLLTESTSISANGVYFLAPVDGDVVYTINGGTYTSLVIIGRYPSGKPKVVCNTSPIALGEGDAVIFKNLGFTARENNYTFYFSTSNPGVLDHWIIDDCKITTSTGVNQSYFNSTSSAVANTIWTNNSIDMQATSNGGAMGLIYYNGIDVANVKTIKMENNIIYAGTSGRYIYGPAIFVKSTLDAPNIDVTFKNNSLVNYLGASGNALIYVPGAGNMTIDKNIFWNGSQGVNSSIINYTVSTSGATVEAIDDNIYYGLNASYSYYMYSTAGKYTGTSGNAAMTKLEVSPFSAWSVTTGTFTQKDEYAAYGAIL